MGPSAVSCPASHDRFPNRPLSVTPHYLTPSMCLETSSRCFRSGFFKTSPGRLFCLKDRFLQSAVSSNHQQAMDLFNTRSCVTELISDTSMCKSHSAHNPTRKNFNRLFSNKGIQVPIWTWKDAQQLWEIQIETTVRYHFLPLGWLSSKRQKPDTNQCW